MRVLSQGRIAPEHPALAGHFPEHPVVPGVLLLTEVLSVAERHWNMARGAVTLTAVKFRAVLRPGDPFSLSMETEDRQQIAFTITSGDATIASGSLRHHGAVVAPVTP